MLLQGEDAISRSKGAPMTEKQPHPLRCETCDYKNKNKSCPAYDVANSVRFDDLKFAADIIRCVGCASHSSAKSDDAVLEEKIELLRTIEKELFKCIYIRGLEITAVNSLFSRHIVELRQKEHE
jgi:flavoprotein